MERAHRPGKVFVDWSQNDPGKSTVAPYSLRGLRLPTVSMPVSWDEVDQAARASSPDELVFTALDVPGRVDRHGDLSSPALELKQQLPPRL